jgi:hypothetical protein
MYDLGEYYVFKGRVPENPMIKHKELIKKGNERSLIFTH